MDLEQFYGADPRRRHSEELEFGSDWTDGATRCGVSWVAATGELYVMREPLGQVVTDPIGDTIVRPVSDEQLGIEVLGVVAGKARVEAVMSGWPDAMGRPGSLAWVRRRLAHQSEELDEPPAQPSDDLDAY